MSREGGAELQFHVLGPLQATRGQVLLPLGGERQRALLALLLTRAGRPLGTEELVELLFDSARVGHAPNAVHAAVSRLRRTLRGPGGAPVATRAGGYVLEHAGEQLDSARFERLLGEGRMLMSSGAPDDALSTLTKALELWRGPAFADLARFDFLAAEARRLDELRLLATIERIEAGLALGRHDELVPEIEQLVLAHPLQERVRGQLMLALYRSGRQAEALEVYRDTSRLLRVELGLEPSAQLRELEVMVLRHDASLHADAGAKGGRSLGAHGTLRAGPPATVEESPANVCPFKGLAFFESSDAQYFCGRERLVSELVAHLAESTLVGIIGPSGIGKSSLLRAGVMEALASGALPRSHQWRQVLLRPGAHPVEELDRVLGDVPLEDRVVVAVDQLEELFTACDSEPERRRFLDRLVQAAREHRQRVLVVCAVRSDFYGRFGSHRPFAELLSRNHVLVGPMDRDELRRAIVVPAARAGLEVEVPLVDALVAEAADEPGGLPLLSTALLELWQQRRERTLRFDSYRISGGVRGAVARLAESAFGRLDASERRVARHLLLRLASGEEDVFARRRVRLEELEQIDGAGPVLAALTDARLLAVDGASVELAHEALLREWPRYRAWLEEDRNGRRLHSHLIAAAREWKLRDRDPAELYRGARLAGALEWAAENDDWLNALERAFLDAGRFRQERLARQRRREERRLRGLVLAVGLLVAVAGCAGGLALAMHLTASHATRVAQAATRAAFGRQLGEEAISEPRLAQALTMAREAVALDRSPQTDSTLLSTLLRSPAVIGTFATGAQPPVAVAAAPDGETLALAEQDNHRIAFYDVRTHAQLPAPAPGYDGDQPPAYSPDGSLLAYTDQEELVVRRTNGLALVARLQLAPGLGQQATAAIAPTSVLFGPYDRTLYCAYWLVSATGRPLDAFVDRWALPSGRLLARRSVDSGPLLAARLLHGGSRLAIVDTHAIGVFRAASMQLERWTPLPATLGTPSAAAVSPDGSTAALLSANGSLWLAATGGRGIRRAAGEPVGAPVTVFYSPDGRTVTGVGESGRVAVWSATRETELRTFPGTGGQVQSAAISPDGTTLYTFSPDGDLLAWDLTQTRQFGIRAKLGADLGCCGGTLAPPAPLLAISPDGSRFAAPVGDNAVGVFSTATLRRVQTLRVPAAAGSVSALAWSSAAPLVAVGTRSGLVELFDLASAPASTHLLSDLLALGGRPEAVQGLAFSPDGGLVAATDVIEVQPSAGTPALTEQYLAEWSTATATEVLSAHELYAGAGPGRWGSLAFAPTGRLLAASLPDGTVSLIQVEYGQVEQTLRPAGGSTVLAFSRDGILATGTGVGTVELWNPHTGRRLAPVLIAASAPIAAVAFDPSGQRFATSAVGDGTVKLWFTASLQQEGPSLPTDPETTAAAAFDPAGRLLLALDDRGSAASWPASLAAWERRACQMLWGPRTAPAYCTSRHP